MRRSLSFLFLFILATFSLSRDSSGAARKAPYLIFENNNTEVTILWHLYSTSSCLIEWGFDESYSLGSASTSEYGGDHQHKFTLTGLSPGQPYYYRVTAAGQTYSGSFRTAPQSSSNRVKFMIYGDSRTFPDIHDQVAERMLSAISSDPDYRTVTLSVGDLVTDGDIESYWDIEHFNQSYTNIEELLASTPYLSAFGNHDGSGPLFVKYFPYPFDGSRYWSYDYGPAHFTVVDQYTEYTPGSTQYSWIESDLASTTKAWKFIYLHRPGWGAGPHSNDTTVQNYIQPLCRQYGVSIVFAGHNHCYARAVVDGIQHVTTGGGGAPLHSPDPGYPYVVATSMNYHFCQIEIDGNVLHCDVITPGGTTIDSFTLENPADVPSLSSWGMILLGLLLVCLATIITVKSSKSHRFVLSGRRD